MPGATIDAQATARGLEALKADLDTKLSAVQDEVREAQLARTARDRAMATFDQTFGAIAGLYESLFRLSGEHELADRVRPSRRRPGKTEEGPDSPEPNPAPGR